MATPTSGSGNLVDEFEEAFQVSIIYNNLLLLHKGTLLVCAKNVYFAVDYLHSIVETIILVS